MFNQLTLRGTFVKTGEGTSAQRTAVFTAQRLEGAKVTFIEQSTNLGRPSMIEVSHDIKPIGANGNDRHTISVKRAYSGAKGTTHIASATLTLSYPRDDVADEGTIRALPLPDDGGTPIAEDVRDMVLSDVAALLVSYLNRSGTDAAPTWGIQSTLGMVDILKLSDGITP